MYEMNCWFCTSARRPALLLGLLVTRCSGSCRRQTQLNSITESGDVAITNDLVFPVIHNTQEKGFVHFCDKQNVKNINSSNYIIFKWCNSPFHHTLNIRNSLNLSAEREKKLECMGHINLQIYINLKKCALSPIPFRACFSLCVFQWRQPVHLDGD